MRSGKALFAILSLLLFSTAAVRSQALGNLVGQVRLMNGSFPAARVMVTLQTRGATVNSAYTDNEGRFGFFNLIPNPYHVVVEEDEYQPVNLVVNVDPNIAQTTQVRIILTPRDMSKAMAPPGAVPGGNPNLIRSSEYAKKFSKDVIKEFEAGVKADEADRPEKAMEHYRKAIQLAPDFYPAHNNLGVRHLSRSAFSDAEGEFREVLKLNKDDAQAYFNLGNVLYLTKRFEEARRLLQEGLSKSPNSALGNYLLGSVQLRLGDANAAERLLIAAKQLDPRMSQVLLELATLYLQTGRKAEAKGQLEEFLRRYPKDPLVPRVKERLTKLASPAP